MIRTVVGNVLIAGFFALFIAVNVHQFYLSGSIGYLFVAANESVYVVLYLVRQRATAVSTFASDWAIAFSATFFGTLLRPGYPFEVPIGTALIVVGTLINMLSVLYLNRSIGIVPAERGIKTKGPYRFIRHPMYASGILTLSGYLLSNVSRVNAFIGVATIALLLVRINREELLLCKNERYRNYAGKTIWKLLPFVY